jgi:hypothetical protein
MENIVTGSISIMSINLDSNADYFRQELIKNLHGPSPRADYTDRATAACRRSDIQLLRIEGATWSQ